MDFNSLMKTASNNKMKAAVETKTSALLKTKLAPPKKDAKKKIDVAAIKKRIDDEKKRLEPPKPKPPIKIPGKKILTKLKPKPEKPKYENKQHEQNHSLFMKNVKRIGSKAEKKTEPTKEVQAPVVVKPEKPKVKPIPKKQLPKPPNFRELMALAENAQKDPKALQDFNKKIKHKQLPPKEQRRNDFPRPDFKRDRSSPVDHKLKSSTSSGKSLPQTLDSKPTKTPPSYTKTPPSYTKTPPSYTKTLNKARTDDSRKSTSNTQMKSEEYRKKDYENSSSNEQTNNATKIFNKPGPSNKSLGLPNGLSEAQRAKLAMRNMGRRVPPSSSNNTRTEPIPSGLETRPSSKQTSQKPANKQTSQNPVNKQTSQKRSHEFQPIESEPVKKKSLNPYNNPYADGKSAWDRLHPQPKETNSKNKNKRYVDSEDEYDDYDDMDDFIDDGDEQVDISSAIRDIFGYDKRRYKDEDFDDRSMVAGYADIMKEEVRSSKIAAKEDLEEHRKEEEARVRKLEKKKKK